MAEKDGWQSAISSAIKKYGFENFSCVILEKDVESFQILKEAEKKWITIFNSYGPDGYNLTVGGDGVDRDGRPSPLVGRVVSDETKKKISEANRGEKNHSHLAAGPSHWNRGLVRSEETRRKIREARAKQVSPSLGRPVSDDVRKRISDKLRKYFSDPENRKKISKRNAGKLWSSARREAYERKWVDDNY